MAMNLKARAIRESQGITRVTYTISNELPSKLIMFYLNGRPNNATVQLLSGSLITDIMYSQWLAFAQVSWYRG
jgi:hypothetical protein